VRVEADRGHPLQELRIWVAQARKLFVFSTA